MLAVLGSGSWGTALANVVAENYPQQRVYLWGRNQQVIDSINDFHINQQYLPNLPLATNIVATSDLGLALEDARDILISVPSSAFSAVAFSISKLIKPHQRVVFATKGLEKDSGRFLSQVLHDIFGDSVAVAALSGPSFAKEVVKSLNTAVVVASSDRNFQQDLVKYFHNANFRVYTSDDLLGIQLAGVIKNVLAVATGIADGLELGANSRAALITRGLAEGLQLFKAMHIEPKTMFGLAGIGDIILTCTDNQSRNRRFGLYLADGLSMSAAVKQIGQAVEAIDNVKELYNLALEHKVEMPITYQVQQVTSGVTTARVAAEELMNRQPTTEFSGI